MENSTLQTIHNRRSVRSYKDEPVTPHQLETLAMAGMSAPSAVNRQPWVFIAIDDRAVLDALGSKLPYARMLLHAPSAIVVCGDMQRALEEWQQEFWIQDCAAATQNILLAAESMGLGAVWTAVYPARERIEIVKNTLNLPDHIVPLNVIPVGYPSGNEKPKNKWNPDKLKWNSWDTRAAD